MKTNNLDQINAAKQIDVDAQRESLDDPPGWQQIAKERLRQIMHEGYLSQHDDTNRESQLAMAAACYAAGQPIFVPRSNGVGFRDAWPWCQLADKREQHGYERRLVIAGALICAELDRLRRQRIRLRAVSPDAGTYSPVASAMPSDENGRLTLAWERKGMGQVLFGKEMSFEAAKTIAAWAETASVEPDDDELGELGTLAQDQAEWSQATFGPDSERGPIGALKHLEKEAHEAQQSPTDPSEYADCLLLVLDAARRAGFDHKRLLREASEKMRINRSREWPQPTSDEPVEHVRENAAACGGCCEGPASIQLEATADSAPTKLQARLKGLVISAEFEPGSANAFLESLGELIGAVFSGAATSAKEPTESVTG